MYNLLLNLPKKTTKKTSSIGYHLKKIYNVKIKLRIPLL